jgi:hypothetical protein
MGGIMARAAAFVVELREDDDADATAQRVRTLAGPC